MAEQNPIRYSDLIAPDDSIEKLIEQLEKAQDAYGKMAQSIKTQSAQIAASLNSVSGSNEAGRANIIEASKETEKLTRAMRDLNFAESENAKRLAELKQAQKEANDLNKLTVKLNESAEGSYNRLSAQYSINKIYLNNMTKEERKGTEEGRKLERQTREIYEEMKRLQEATGKMSLNVGNYEGAIESAIGVQSKWFTSLKGIGGLFEGGFTNGLKTAGSAVGAFGKQLLGLLMNPVVATIAAITAAFMALSKGISSSEENTEKLNRILIPFKVILDKLIEGLQSFAGWILKGVEGLENMALSVSKLMERLPVFGDYFKRFNNAVQRNIELSKQKQAEDKKEAKTQNALAKSVSKSTASRISSYRDEAEKRRRLMEEQGQKEQQAIRQAEDAKAELIEDSYDKERAQTILQYDRQIEDLRTRLEKEKDLTEKARAAIASTMSDLELKKQSKLADIWDKQLNDELTAMRKAREKEDAMRKETLSLEEKQINDEYELSLTGIDGLHTSEYKKTQMRLEAEKERLKKLLALYKKDGKTLSDTELSILNQQIQNIENEMEENEKEASIWDRLGLNDEQKKAIDDSVQYAIDNLNRYMDAYLQAAEARKQAADEEVDRAQRVLEKEIEARANGYANEVETARKELDLAKKNQAKALKEQQKAQRAQEAIDTATQVSSLITATANIWKAFTGGAGIFGVALAVAATALMWGSFAAAKIKAHEVAGSGTEEYGEGTVELLQGGSHLSGNDIDLGRKPDGTRRRAEGGEYFAVFNKRNSRKYGSIIPSLVRSINNGTFDKGLLYNRNMTSIYDNAYNGGDIETAPIIDVSRMEKGIDRINYNLEKPQPKTYTDQNGNTVIIYKNLTRRIKN